MECNCAKWIPGLLLLGLLSGCGGPAMTTPTAIPASVVRPVQSTPVYASDASVFALITPGTAPQFVPTPADDNAAVEDLGGGGARAAIQLYMQDQTPSAVAIAPGGATIYAERGGRAAASVPVGGVLTVTGKSADGGWYAVYNEEGAYGWTPAGQLRVYGGDDLVVVDEAPDPGPIATLLAQAAQPVRVLDDLMVQMAATATQAANEAAQQPPTATPIPTAVATPIPAPLALPAATAEPAAGAEVSVQAGDQTGIVSSDGRLNLRTQPDTAAAIVRKLDPGDTVAVLARSTGSDGAAWLQVRLADGTTGWVAAEFVALQ